MQAVTQHNVAAHAAAGHLTAPVLLGHLSSSSAARSSRGAGLTQQCSLPEAPAGLGTTSRLCLTRRQRHVASLVPTSCAASSMHPSHNSQAATQQSVLTNPITANVMAGMAAMAQSMSQLGTFLGSVLGKVRNAVAAVFPQVDNITAQDVHVQLRALSSNMRLLALVAPFARAASSESLTALYARTFERAAFGFAKMYLFCLFMRVLLSWFPGIDWNAQPWTFLRLITEPYLQIYRGILPPLFGQLDFTPLLGFLILQDVVEVMAPTYTMGLHDHDTSTRWTTSDVMCYFDGF